MQATSTATATRVNLGPLTTAFSPPGDCTSLRFITEDVVFMGAAIGYGCHGVQWLSVPCTTGSDGVPINGAFTCPIARTATDGIHSGMVTTDWLCSSCNVGTSSSNRDFSLTQSCYPPKFASSFKPTIYDTEQWSSQPPIYSPGLNCPSGYLPTCTVERIKEVTNSAAATTVAKANDIIWSMLNDGEIAIGCCPSNYACDPNSPHLCISTPPPGDIIAVTDGISCSSGTAASPSPTALSAEAIRIVLVKSSDLTAASDDTSKSSFGNGAKIAIGIVIPVVALLIGAAALYFLRRRKRLQKQTSDQEVLSEGDRSDPGLKAELPGSIAATISGPKGVAYQKPELDNTVIAILPELATDPPRDEIQELHGNTLTVKPTNAITPASKPHDLIGHSVVRADEQNPVGILSGTELGNPSELGLWNWSNFDTPSRSNESYEHLATGGHQ